MNSLTKLVNNMTPRIVYEGLPSSCPLGIPPSLEYSQFWRDRMGQKKHTGWSPLKSWSNRHLLLSIELVNDILIITFFGLAQKKKRFKSQCDSFQTKNDGFHTEKTKWTRCFFKNRFKEHNDTIYL